MGERTQFDPELSDEVKGPYIDPTNRFEVTGDEESVRLKYDVLNSMTWPVLAVEGTVELTRGDDLRGSDRGAVLEDLWMSDEKWRQAVEKGTIYLPPDGDNVRYFDIPKAPGDGLLVMDYFIPFETSGPPPVQLKGDDRDFHPDGPLAP